MNNDINKFYLCGLKKNDIRVFKKDDVKNL